MYHEACYALAMRVHHHRPPAVPQVLTLEDFEEAEEEEQEQEEEEEEGARGREARGGEGEPGEFAFGRGLRARGQLPWEPARFVTRAQGAATYQHAVCTGLASHGLVAMTWWPVWPSVVPKHCSSLMIGSRHEDATWPAPLRTTPTRAEDLHDLDLRVAVDVAAMAQAARNPLSRADVALIKCVCAPGAGGARMPTRHGAQALHCCARPAVCVRTPTSSVQFPVAPGSGITQP